MSTRSALVLLTLLAGCGAPPSPPRVHRITQVSLINALMLGRYDGVMPIGEVLRRGDFGVGTLDHLDGELVVLDGHAFQVRGDGEVRPVPHDRSTPFATVLPFRGTPRGALTDVASLADLDSRLDALVGEPNRFVALRIDGRFARLRLRSVHRQEPPYRPLAEVAQSQSEWTHSDLEGTLVGIRCPVWTAGLNVPGYHWHFLSHDRRVGGHVLGVEFKDADLSLDVCSDWTIELDPRPDFNSVDLTPDLRRDLERVEQAREPSR